MDTLPTALTVRVPRSRGYGFLALAAVLAVATALSDPAGRLLTAPAVLVVLVLAVVELRAGPLLVADADGIQVRQGLRHVRVRWAEVERMRVLRDRRAELLELDLGRTIALLSRQRLGRLPEDVLADLLALRGQAESGR